MKADIIVIGGGASGLMAAYGAAGAMIRAGRDVSVTVLEKMPRPGRKIMITGKGRCNFSNIKEWNDFCTHIRTNPQFVKPAFFNLDPAHVVEFFRSAGMESVVERGERAYPASHLASDVVDALVRACLGKGVKIETEAVVEDLSYSGESSNKKQSSFQIVTSDGRKYSCSRLIIATGGLSYPGTGSTGDGYVFALNLGHSITPLFPSLTALVPVGYKTPERNRSLREACHPRQCQREGPIACDGRDDGAAGTGSEGTVPLRHHIDRSVPLSARGEALCGVKLKNVGLQLIIEGSVAQDEFGDIDFTDGGIEGPLGFKVSRKAVKALINGSRVRLVLDLKPGVKAGEISSRVKELWAEIGADTRSRGLGEKEKCRILLGKLMPRELVRPFMDAHSCVTVPGRKLRQPARVNLQIIAAALKEWAFDIEGFVGYERAVVTAGGISTDEVIAKTLESRLVPGLHFCGEVLDIDSDTGGYNLQTAFSTGYLAGQSAAASL